MSVHDLYEKRKSFFMTPPAALRGAILASLLVGVAVLGYGFFAGEGKRVWELSFLTYFSSLQSVWAEWLSARFKM